MDNPPLPDAVEGRVVKKTIEYYGVRLPDDRLLPCTLSNRLRKSFETRHAPAGSKRQRVHKVREIRSFDPVAVGDRVLLVDARDGTGVIRRILPRERCLSRKTAGKRKDEQVIAANIDRVLVTFAVNEPPPNWNMIDRFLVIASAASLPAILCLTKADLATDPSCSTEIPLYRNLGYPVLLVSALEGHGFDDLREHLADSTTVMAGPSGVGKTSLLNTLVPNLKRKTSEVSSSTGKGRHTTRHVELYLIPSGGELIDSPGVRELGLHNIPASELHRHFPDIARHIGHCRFSDCRHQSEPHCAIRNAISDGQLSPRRFQSYLRLQEECGT